MSLQTHEIAPLAYNSSLFDLDLNDFREHPIEISSAVSLDPMLDISDLKIALKETAQDVLLDPLGMCDPSRQVSEYETAEGLSFDIEEVALRVIKFMEKPESLETRLSSRTSSWILRQIIGIVITNLDLSVIRTPLERGVRANPCSYIRMMLESDESHRIGGYEGLVPYFAQDEGLASLRFLETSL